MRLFKLLLTIFSAMAAFSAFADEPNDSVVYAPTDSISGIMELEGVEVTARKPLIQTEADRLTYNVDEDPAAASNNVIEMMRKVPMLSVDGEDNVKLKGEENYKIYLNGKPDPTLSSNYKEVLRSMPASTVKKIEVITEPGAKYDAEGLGGIINIITFSGTRLEGYTVNLGVYAGNTSASEYLYGTIKLGNVTLSANYSHNNSYSPASTSNNTLTYTEQTSPYQWIRNSRSKNTGYSNYGSLQMSWEPDTLNLFTVSANLWQGNYKGRPYSYSYYTDRTGATIASYNYRGDARNDYTNVGAQANWQHNFSSPERNIVLSYKYDYGHSLSDADYFYEDVVNFPEGDLPDKRVHSKYPTHEHTFQADYTNPFNKKHTLEIGAKYILRQNYGDTYNAVLQDGLWIPDTPNCIDMKQFQDVGSVYASYIGKFGKLMTKAGLRYEFTHMGTRFRTPGHTDFTTNLQDPVPSALISWRINDASNIKASYRMSITRPAVSQLDPTMNTASPGALSYGNPDLTSENSHYASLSYSNYGGSLGGEISAGYSRSNNLITNYSFVDAEGIIRTTYGNMGHSEGVNLNAYLNWRPVTGPAFNLSGGARYAHFRCPQINLDSDGWGSNLYFSADYTLPSKWEFGLYGGWYYQGVYMQYRSNTASSWYGLSVSKNLWNDRVTISLSASDFFEPYMRYKSTITGPGYVQQSWSRYCNWSIHTGVRVRLGSLSVSVKQTAKSVSNDDLSSGGGQGSGQGGNK